MKIFGKRPAPAATIPRPEPQPTAFTGRACTRSPKVKVSHLVRDGKSLCDEMAAWSPDMWDLSDEGLDRAALLPLHRKCQLAAEEREAL